MIGLYFKPAGNHLRFEPAQILAAVERGLDGILFTGRRPGKNDFLFRRLHPVFGGVAERQRQRCLPVVHIHVQNFGSLHGASDVERCLFGRHRQFLALAYTRLQQVRHFPKAFYLLAGQLAVLHHAHHIQIETSRAIGHLIPLGALIDGRGASVLFRLGHQVTLGLVVNGHHRLGLQNGRRRAFNAQRISRAVSRSAAHHNFRAKRIPGHTDGQLGLLLIDPRQGQVRVLLQGLVQSLSQSEFSNFGVQNCRG